MEIMQTTNDSEFNVIHKPITYEDIQKVNDEIQTLDIKRKNKTTGEMETKKYANVNERIKAFRKLYPEGTIETEIVSHYDGIIVMKASAFNNMKLLGTGTAYEDQSSSYINNTSYIENCETSAVGRCLAMLGLGIDTSIASAEEIEGTKEQEKKNEKIAELELKEHQRLEEELDRMIVLNNVDYDGLTAKYKTDDIHLMSNRQLKNAIDNIDKFEKKVN